MKDRAHIIYFVALGISAFLLSGLAAAEPDPSTRPTSAADQGAALVEASRVGVALPSTQYPPNYRLAQANKPSAQEACESRCRRAYRRCYSQGNRVGTPEVHGGAPCSEQKQTCLRACAR